MFLFLYIKKKIHSLNLKYHIMIEVWVILSHPGSKEQNKYTHYYCTLRKRIRIPILLGILLSLCQKWSVNFVPFAHLQSIVPPFWITVELVCIIWSLINMVDVKILTYMHTNMAATDIGQENYCFFLLILYFE